MIELYKLYRISSDFSYLSEKWTQNENFHTILCPFLKMADQWHSYDFVQGGGMNSLLGKPCIKELCGFSFRITFK